MRRRVCHLVALTPLFLTPGFPSYAGMCMGERIPRPLPSPAQHIPTGPRSAPLGSHSKPPVLIAVSLGPTAPASPRPHLAGGTVALGREPRPEKSSRSSLSAHPPGACEGGWPGVASGQQLELPPVPEQGGGTLYWALDLGSPFDTREEGGCRAAVRLSCCSRAPGASPSRVGCVCCPGELGGGRTRGPRAPRPYTLELLVPRGSPHPRPVPGLLVLGRPSSRCP